MKQNAAKISYSNFRVTSAFSKTSLALSSLLQGWKIFFLSGNMGQRLEIFLGWFLYAHASQWLSVIHHVYEL